MTISSLSGRLAALIAAVVILAVLMAGWFVLLSPQRSEISSLDGQISQTQAQVASTQAYVSSPATKQAIAQLAHLKAMVPDDARVSQILRQLSAAATGASVRIDSIQPGAAAAVGSAQAVPIALTVEGHYFGLSKFLHLLRVQARVKGRDVVGRGRLYSVTGIQFNTGVGTTGTTGGAGTITATVSLNAFVNGAAPVAAATTTTATP